MYGHLVLSKIVCQHPGCDKRIKQRLVDHKARHNILYCYRHEPIELISGHSKRRFKDGKIPEEEKKKKEKEKKGWQK